MFFLPQIAPKSLTDALHRLRFLAYLEQKALFFASKFNFLTDSKILIQLLDTLNIMHQPMRVQTIWKGVLAVLCGLGLLMPTRAFADCGFSIEAIVYTDAHCGQSDGTAQLVMSAGAPAVTFLWSNTATTASVSGLAAGVYSVTVSNGASCTIVEQVYIENDGAAVVSNPSANAGTCQQANGSLTFTLSGNGNFGVAWTGAATGSLSGVSAGVVNIPNLVAGDYQLTITDANGCLSFAALTVPEVGGITANFTTTQQPTCGGGTNGVLRAQATSGSLPFTFFINGVSQGTFFSNTFDYFTLPAGTYTLTIVESGGCSVSQTITLNEVGTTALNPADFAFIDATCPSGADGSATAVACATCEVYNMETGLLVGNMATPITTLTAGAYQVRFDNAGCVSVLDFEIGDPAAWGVGGQLTNSTCTAGQADVDMTVSGATANYTYQWSNGANSQDLLDVFPGAYALTVTDAVGCTFSPAPLVVDPCNSTEVITVFTGSTVTFCVDTADVAGNVSSVFNICPGLVDNGTFGTIGLDGCITFTASFQEGFDTLCIEVCGDSGFDCDTTTVVFQIESTADTLFTYVQTNQSATLCPPLIALPGSVSSAANLGCSVNDNGLVGNIDQTTGCVTFNAGGQMGLDTVCMLVCDNLGFCDTAVMIFQVISPIDTVNVGLYAGSTTTYCPNLSALSGAVAGVTNLNCAVLSNGAVDAINTANGCVTYTAGNIAGSGDQVCLQICDVQGNCDTVVVLFNSVPQSDTAYIAISAGSGVLDTCVFGIQFPGQLAAVTNLGCDANNIGGISVNISTGCVTYTPPASVPNSGIRADTVCLVLCDNSTPVAYCDTVVYIFNNLEPVCTPEIPANIATQVTDCNTGDVCLDIPLDSIGGYTFEVNGQPYAGAFGACNVVRRIQYPLSLIPPCDSSYSVSWVVNGTTFGPAVVNGYAGIVAQLNTWDGNTVWSYASNPDRVLGITNNDALNYGSLNIGCVGSGVSPIGIGASEQAQYSLGTNIDFGDPGSYTLTVTNPLNCVDVALVEIYCTSSEIVNDTVELGSTATFCGLDVSQVPNVSSISNACASASTGNATFTIDAGNLCVSFTGDSLGSDLACIIVCSNDGVCDTTFFFVEVVVPVPIAVRDSAVVDFNTTSTNFDVCLNDTINALTPYTIAVLQQPAHGQVTATDCDFVYTVAGGFCGIDSFRYVVANASGSDTATVVVETECKPFSISEAISPNGDGFNDFFVVNSLQDYPNHEIFVFNRWGARVFQAKNYQNDWNGLFNGRDLPDGNYFYLIYLNDGKSEFLNGPLVIQR